MQKSLRTQLLTRNQSVKKLRKSIYKTRKGEEKEYERWATTRGKALRNQVRNERLNRREDWIAGPLAADRNTGLQKGVLGSVHLTQAQNLDLPRHVVKGPKEDDASFGYRKEWQGEGNEFNIVAGDRVCIVRGVEDTIGSIGVVEGVDTAKGELRVRDLNKVSMLCVCGIC